MDVAIFLLITITIGALIESVGTYSCSTGELEKCLTMLRSAAQTEDLALPTTRKDLYLVCRELQRGVKCVDDHSTRCFNSAQQRIFDSIVSESRQVIESLCVEGEAQEDFLRYAPCFRNISTDETKCATKFKKMAILSQNMEGEDKETGLRKVCCALTDFTQCKHDHAMRDCGPMASEFLQRYMDRMSGSLINQHCVLYTYGSDSCLSNGSQRVVFPSIESTCLIFISLFRLLSIHSSEDRTFNPR